MKATSAMIRTTAIDSRTNRIEIRSGEKGTGKQLWSCQYWPDSWRSVEQMEEYLAQEIERLESNGWNVTPEEVEEW